MELRRRKKEEEKLSTENKIKEVKVLKHLKLCLHPTKIILRNQFRVLRSGRRGQSIGRRPWSPSAWASPCSWPGGTITLGMYEQKTFILQLRIGQCL